MIQLTGVVVGQNRDTFEVEVEVGSDDNTKKTIVHAKPAGKLRMNYIKILEGDTVDIEVSPYDVTKGRITYRHK